MALKATVQAAGIIILSLMSGCSSKPHGFIIDGRIIGIPDGSLVTLYDINQQIDLDSAFTLKERFVLKGHVDHPTTCWLTTANEYSTIEVENVRMTFNSSLKDMHLNSIITGGDEQELRNEVRRLQRPYDVKLNAAMVSLQDELYEDEAQKMGLIETYNDNQKKSQKIYVDFGIQHANSYLGVDILYRNRKSIARDSLTAIYQRLTPEYKESSNGNALKVFLYDKVVALGEPLVDFEATSINGQPFRLSSKLGSYIYLTFWSSGCGPCRMENKFLSKNFARIPEMLSVVSFSIDRNIEAWKKASDSDDIYWDNVSDLAGEKGKIKTQYEVQAIPLSYLIDPEGMVIKRFGGFNPDEDIIEKLLQIIEQRENS
ncbi:MAG: thiol:disulfide interchange protein [Cyclobacteriaceae bacterium]|nr:MAG: thiol:disulfide interchange protein [Cyclobacteriaceae bacterium]